MDLIFSIITPILNCLQLLPQLIKTYRTKKVDDLSMASLILILSTNLLWFIYYDKFYRKILFIKMELFRNLINCYFLLLLVFIKSVGFFKSR